MPTIDTTIFNDDKTNKAFNPPLRYDLNEIKTLRDYISDHESSEFHSPMINLLDALYNLKLALNSQKFTESNKKRSMTVWQETLANYKALPQNIPDRDFLNKALTYCINVVKKDEALRNKEELKTFLENAFKQNGVNP